jgi:uncharacterized membrane protein
MPFILALLCGLSAGLRSLTPPAIVAWAAQSWPAVRASPVGFMSAPATAYVFTVLAVLELIGDKLPFTPSRLKAGPLGARILSGALTGAVLCVAAQQSLAAGAVVGALAGVAGAFAGYKVRRHLTVERRLPDLLVAIAEDLCAIGLTMLAVSRL